jgi:hypothetical protein
MNFLRERRVFWVPVAPASSTFAQKFPPERIRPDGGMEAVLQVGEGLEHGGDSVKPSGPGAGDGDGASQGLCQHHGRGVAVERPGGLGDSRPSPPAS